MKVLDNVDGDPSKKYFADGTLLHILNRDTSWEDMFENTFIEAELYDELVNDISQILYLFKNHTK